MIFLQKSLECNCITTKERKMLVLDSTDFQSSSYAEFVSILNMLAKLLSFTFIFSYIVLDIMINLLDINNFLNIFLHKITRLTSTTYKKKEFIPQIDKKKW